MAIAMTGLAVLSSFFGSVRYATREHGAAKAGAGPPRSIALRYEYHNCPVFVSNDWLTTSFFSKSATYVPKAVDPNSDKLIRNMVAAFGNINFAGNVPTNEEGVNLVNSRNILAMPMIRDIIYGFANNRYNDDPPPPRIKINRGIFMQEGTAYCRQPGQDCHVNVLDTDRCVEYETYRSGGLSWDGSRYTAEGGGVENLTRPYQIEHITVSAAHLPMMGTTDWGEDLQYQRADCAPTCAIPHVLAFFLPLANKGIRGYVRPADGSAGTCSAYCDLAIPYGARLRLHVSYACPNATVFPQANLLCNQAKQYGLILNDTVGREGSAGVRLGLSSDASDLWRSADFNEFLGKVHVRDFDVVTLGTIEQ